MSQCTDSSREQPRVGTLVGKDQYGNEYFQNDQDQSGRSRWVIYHKWNWDASQVPPEWHQWLHRFTDDAPSKVPLETKFFTPAHYEHLTGTTKAYKPYSTTKPKIEAWNPNKK